MADNGGASAIKGFNYQTAVVSVVAIRNFTKPNFTIYVEADDDFEVLYDDNFHALIQVKGEKKVSLSSLMYNKKSKGKEMPSILEKSLLNPKGTDESHYKIVVYNFTQSDLDEASFCDNEIFGKCYKFSESQKEKFREKLKSPRVEQLSLIKTIFSTDEKDSDGRRKFLKGEMADAGIVIDNRHNQILNELQQIILQKSGIEIKKDSDRELKKITCNELQDLLCKASSLERFERELDSLGFNSFKKEKILHQRTLIYRQYSSYKKKVLEFLLSNSVDLEQDNLTTICSSVFQHSIEFSPDEENAKYAVCISAYCDILEGVARNG